MRRARPKRDAAEIRPEPSAASRGVEWRGVGGGSHRARRLHLFRGDEPPRALFAQ